MESPQHPLILVVEDTPWDRELLTTVLEREGYEVVSAIDGARAKDLAASRNPVLILLDVLMPGMDGIEVCRGLKADALTRGITNLLDAFSPSRLSGKAAPLPPYYVTVPEALIQTLPQAWGFGGCQYLGITTTDRQQGIVNAVPSDFNPRPKTNPN